MKCMFTVLCLVAIGLLSTTAYGAFIPEAGGADAATAQVIVSSGDDTITGGISGDALLIGSGIATVTSGSDGVAGRFQVSLAGGTADGTYTLSTTPNNGAFGGDGTARQYSDATFTTEVFFDDDDAAGLYPEFRPGDATTVNPDGTVHLEFGDFGDDGDLEYGYDVLDTTNATRNNDFFRVTGLTPGGLLTAEYLSDGDTFGFFDGRIILYDTGGTVLANVDADNSPGSNPYFEVASATVPADGIVIVEATHSGGAGRAGGTYELQLTSVPEPSTFALIALCSLALLGFRRRT